MENAGAWPPNGLQLHVLFGSEGDLRSARYGSREQLRAFGEQLMPVLNEVGVQVVGEPEVFEVHVLEQPQTTG
jgi:hypothetical protein